MQIFVAGIVALMMAQEIIVLLPSFEPATLHQSKWIRIASQGPISAINVCLIIDLFVISNFVILCV